jgi:hypothetical protein
MKEYGCCPKFKRGDNSTYTFTKRGGGMYLVGGGINIFFNFSVSLTSEKEIKFFINIVSYAK